MMRLSRDRVRRLRKQPKLRRMQSSNTLALPKVVVPPAARKRKWRNDPRIQVPIEMVKNVALTSRWISLVLVTIAVWALISIGQNRNFYLSVIPVIGANSIPDSEIVKASSLEGRHIFAASPADAADQVRAISGVISATVMLKWPNEATIQITEDTPVAIWKQAGRTYWVNETGELLPARSMITGLLVIDSEAREPLKNDAVVPDPVLSGALQLRKLRSNIDHLYYSLRTGLSYQDGRGWRAHFGTGLDMEQKLVVYETIVDDLLERGLDISYISVRNQEKPYYLAK